MILSPSPWWSAIPSLGAVLGYALLALRPARQAAGGINTLILLVWLLHALALAAGHAVKPVRFGFAPALSVTAWLVFTLYAVESRVYPKLQVRAPMAALGAAAVLLALLFPGMPHPAAASPWLPLHWWLGIISYGLLAAAVLHGWLARRAEASIRQARADELGLPLLALERLTFRLVAAAFVLLSATLLAGWWFSELLLPQGWSWNHKTVFTLLSWLALAVLLWGRWTQGWRGRFAINMLYAAAALLLLGYVGSRFVLEVILSQA
jgi:ABC-type uncharacterized transport system permease subunit